MQVQVPSASNRFGKNDHACEYVFVLFVFLDQSIYLCRLIVLILHLYCVPHKTV